MEFERFGSRDTFAFEIHPYDENQTRDIRKVDVYAAGVHLTCDDNNVYLPNFGGSVEQDLEKLIDDRIYAKKHSLPEPGLSPTENYEQLMAQAAKGDNTAYLSHSFMQWGPTSDNVTMAYFRLGKTVALPFVLWRDSPKSILCATLPIDELRLTIHQSIWKLVWDWAFRTD